MKTLNKLENYYIPYKDYRQNFIIIRKLKDH